MGNYTIFWMFENPRKGRQARNLQQMVRKFEISIVFRTDIFRKLTLGATAIFFLGLELYN